MLPVIAPPFLIMTAIARWSPSWTAHLPLLQRSPAPAPDPEATLAAAQRVRSRLGRLNALAEPEDGPSTGDLAVATSLLAALDGPRSAARTASAYGQQTDGFQVVRLGEH